jgi:hypothetical protein
MLHIWGEEKRMQRSSANIWRNAHLEDAGVDRRIISKNTETLKKENWRTWIEFIWLTIEKSGVCSEHGIKLGTSFTSWDTISLWTCALHHRADYSVRHKRVRSRCHSASDDSRAATLLNSRDGTCSDLPRTIPALFDANVWRRATDRWWFISFAKPHTTFFAPLCRFIHFSAHCLYSLWAPTGQKLGD